MKKYSILLFICVFALNAFAQKDDKQKKDEKEKTPVATTPVALSKTATPLEIAKAALAAHGGDKLKNLKTLIVRGSAEVSGSPTQVLAATFAMIFSGEKYRFDIQAPPMVNFRQVSDGQTTNSSLRGLSLPPLNQVGLPVLSKIEEKGYVVAALPEKFKKKMGFRVTSPDGYYTDFVIDEKTNRIKEYESTYEMNGYPATTSVAVDQYRDVNGILVNEKFSQRLEMGQMNFYANYKAKEISVDTEIADDVFTMK
jgi:hypothetical protein